MNEAAPLLFFALTAGTVAVGFLAGRGLARRSLGFEARLTPGTLKVGGPLEVVVDLRPRSAVRVDNLELRVLCREVQERQDELLGQIVHNLVRGHHHNNRHRQITTLADERTVFPQNQTFAVGQSLQFHLRTTLPLSGVGSQNLGERIVRWTVEVRCDIPNAPDAVISLPLQVAPRYA